MKSLLKVATALVLSGTLAFQATAETFTIPPDQNGNVPNDVSVMVTDVFVATAATAMGSTTPVVVYGYTVSSDAVTNYALLRDSNTLNTTTNVKLMLFQDGTCSTVTQSCTKALPTPVIFRNGLSINLKSAIVGNGANLGRWMFYVRYLREGVEPFKSPSQVDPRITVDNVGVN